MAFLKKIFDKKENQSADIILKTEIEADSVYAPVSGTVISLPEVGDGVFSEGILGQGCAFIPSEGVIYAPFAGSIITAPESRHAIGIRSKDGIEILIHVGIDTVEMNGQGFSLFAKEGDEVKCGQTVLTFDREAIKEAGHPDTVIVIVTNSNDFQEIKIVKAGKTDCLEKIFAIQK